MKNKDLMKELEMFKKKVVLCSENYDSGNEWTQELDAIIRAVRSSSVFFESVVQLNLESLNSKH